MNGIGPGMEGGSVIGGSNMPCENIRLEGVRIESNAGWGISLPMAVRPAELQSIDVRYAEFQRRLAAAIARAKP